MSKIGFSIEYPCKSASVSVLWNSIGTTPGLSEWFADDVSASGENYCFVWEKYEHQAVMVQRKINSHIRFQWMDDEGTDAYFEIRIEKEAITGELTLIVTDYAIPSDKDDTVLLWNKQIEQLKRKIGL